MVVSPEAIASSASWGQVKWIWESKPPAVRIKPSPAITSVPTPHTIPYITYNFYKYWQYLEAYWKIITPCNTPNFESLKGSWVFLNCNNKLHQYCISIHAHHIQTCSQNSKHNYLCHVCLHTHTLLACNTAELMHYSPTNTTKESKSKNWVSCGF